MKNNKEKRIKRNNYRSEDQEEIIRFIKLLLIIIILIVGVYLFTRFFVTKDLFTKETTTEREYTEGTINYNVTTIGTMLNKPEKEYFVFMYDYDDVNSIYYSGLISGYKKNKDSLKVYVANLSSEFNKNFIDIENINVNTSNLDDFKVGKYALVKISNGRIVKSYTSEEEIKEVLKYVKDTK